MLTPLLLGSVVRLVSWSRWDYLPSGPTGLVFATLSVWRDEVPRLYRYKIVTGGQKVGLGDVPGLVLSDKSTTYLLAGQLAMSQFPYSTLPAAVGWVVGTAWIGDFLPGRMSAWRVPRWLLGDLRRKSGLGAAERERYEGLRRRLEEEGGRDDGMRASAPDEADVDGESGVRRRPMARQIADYFRGRF